MYKLLIIVFIAVTSCGSQQDTTESTPTSQEIASQEGKIAIPLGKSVQIGGEKVTFAKVVEDSRCPIGTQCVWAGLAKVEVHFTEDDMTLDRQIAILEKGESAVLFENQSHTFMATHLNPEPVDGDGGERDYVLTIEVKKK